MEQKSSETEIPEPESTLPEILEQKPEQVTIPLEQDADLHQAHVDCGVSSPAGG